MGDSVEQPEMRTSIRNAIPDGTAWTLATVGV